MHGIGGSKDINTNSWMERRENNNLHVENFTPIPTSRFCITSQCGANFTTGSVDLSWPMLGGSRGDLRVASISLLLTTWFSA